MANKKLTRVLSVALMTLALVALLAVASFAYSVTVDGQVSGLEAGSTYYYAAYDFGTDAYGEFTELTDDTALTAGVWGIKKGEDGDVEPLFFGGSQVGVMTLYDEATGGVPSSAFAGATDDHFQQGKWTVNEDSVFANIRPYSTTNTVGFVGDIRKDRFIDKSTGEVYTETVETEEGTDVNEIPTWSNAKPYADDETTNNNKLTESTIYYTFTNEQVIPANKVEGITLTKCPLMNVGSFTYNTKEDGSAYTVDDVKGSFTYWVKVPGDATPVAYEVETVGDNVKNIGVPAELANAEGYLFAIEWMPWGNCPDDIFCHRTIRNNGVLDPTMPENGDGSYLVAEWSKGYVSVDNSYVPEIEAPVVEGGEFLGNIEGLEEGKHYQAAPLTINADGSALKIGAWIDVDADTTGLAGLWVVRYANADATVVSAPSDIIYITGAPADRKAIGVLLEDSYVHLQYKELPDGSFGDPETWSAKLGGTHTIFADNELSATHNVIATDLLINFYNAKLAYDAAPTDTALQAAYIAAGEAIEAVYDTWGLKYAYASNEIIPISELNTFTFNVGIRQNGLDYTAPFTTDVVAYIADEDGEITTYRTTTNASVKGAEKVADFANGIWTPALPATGYVVGLEIFQQSGFEYENFILNPSSLNEDGTAAAFGQNNPRFSYDLENAVDLDVNRIVLETPVITAGYGTVSGLDSDKNYQYINYALNKDGKALGQVGEWKALEADTELAGFVAVREYFNDIVNSDPSNIVFVYGEAVKRTAIGHELTLEEMADLYIEVQALTGNWYSKLNPAISANIAGKLSFIYDPMDSFIKPGYWSAPHDMIHSSWPTVANPSYGYHRLSAVSTVIATDTINAANSAIEAYNADKSDANKTALDNALSALAAEYAVHSVKYTYALEEIIPISDMTSFAFYVARRQGYDYQGAFSSVAWLYVAQTDGTVTAHKYTTNAPSAVSGERIVNFEAKNSWTPALPETGYAVGLQIYPLGGMTGANIKVAVSTGAMMPSFNYYPAKYVVKMPQVELDAPVIELDQTGDKPVIRGLDDDKTYQYANYAINAAGNGLAIASEWKALDATADLAGIIAVRENLDNKYVGTAYSAPSNLVFVQGLRKQISQPIYDEAFAKNSMPFLKNNGYTQNFVTPGYWSASSGGNHIHGSFGEDRLSPTGAVGTTALYAKAANGTITDAEKATVINEARNYNLKYAYNTDEIISVKEVTQMGYIDGVRIAGLSYGSNTYAATATVYVADLTGKIDKYVYTTDALKVGKLRVIDFKNETNWSPSIADAEGYVVGVQLNPFAGWEYDKLSFTAGTNFCPVIDKFHTNYAFEVDLAPSAKPTNLYAENDVVYGFETTRDYYYAPVTLDGIGTYTKIDGTAFELPVGLTAISGGGNNATTGLSAPVIFYKTNKNPASIIHTSDTTTSNGDPIQIVDAVTLTEAEILSGEVFKDAGKWAAYAASGNSLAVKYGAHQYTLGGGAQWVPSALLTALNNGNEGAQDDILDRMSKQYASYKYNADEIIPFANLKAISYMPTANGTAASVKNVEGVLYTKIVFKVVNEDGEIEERIAKKPVDISRGITTNLATFTPADFADTTGYIVGVVIYYFAEGSEDLVLEVDKTLGNCNTVIAFADVPYETKSYELPTAEVSLDKNGYLVTISNYADGSKYSYSTDGKAWTALDAGDRNFVVDTDSCYIKLDADGSFIGGVAEISLSNLTFKDKPELVLGEGNTLADATGAYEIAKYTLEDGFVYAPLTEATLDDGLWAVRTAADEADCASVPQYFYIRGEAVGSINFAFKYNVGGAFVKGAWTTSRNNAALYQRTGWDGGAYEYHMGAGKKGADGTYTKAEREAYNIKYQFADDELLPIDEATDFCMEKNSFYHGYLKDGYSLDDEGASTGISPRSVAKYGKTKARVYIAGGDQDYYDVYTEVEYDNGFVFEIASQLAGKEGYISAIELYPFWEIYGEDGKTDLGDDCITACWLSTNEWCEPYTIKFNVNSVFVENEVPAGEELSTYLNASQTAWKNANGFIGAYADGTNRFAITVAMQESETPVITTSSNGASIVITNYNALCNYAYSIDGGETWTEFKGSTLRFAYANATYIVKAVKNANFTESEVSNAIVSPGVVTRGVSLVLDGQIGMKLYLDVADDVDPSTINFNTTRRNDDYSGITVDGKNHPIFKQFGAASITNNPYWMTNIQFDTLTGLYYIIFYVSPKDIDNVYFENSITYKTKADVENGVTEFRSGVGYANLSVGDILDTSKSLAAAGNEEFVAAVDLIEAIETYAAYADNYFNGGALEAYASDAANAQFAAAEKTGALTGAEFYATSILLEDKMTIRHYFTVTDIDAFNAAYSSNLEYTQKGAYIYYDITDIAAQDIGTVQVFEIKDQAGKVAFSISYSVGNYIQAMLEDDDANLVSLVNAMYDYYAEAAAYAAN